MHPPRVVPRLILFVLCTSLVLVPVSIVFICFLGGFLAVILVCLSRVCLVKSPSNHAVASKNWKPRPCTQSKRLPVLPRQAQDRCSETHNEKRLIRTKRVLHRRSSSRGGVYSSRQRGAGERNHRKQDRTRQTDIYHHRNGPVVASTSTAARPT